MKARIRRLVLPAPALGLIFALVPPALGAQDLAFHEVGARAASLGGAFMAKADDITAVHYNPAGLAFLKGLRLKTNLVVSRRTIDAGVPGTGQTFASVPGEYLQNIFVTWQPARRIGLGFGAFSPYNFRAEWLFPGWPGNRISLSSRLRSHNLRLALGVEVLKGLALGASLDYVSLGADWTHFITFEPANYQDQLSEVPQIRSLYELSGHGLGFTASALWKPLTALQIGVKFQGETSVDLRGPNSFAFPQNTTWQMVPDPHTPYQQLSWLLDLFYANQAVTGHMSVPREIACGLAWTPVRPVSLYVDLQWNAWSRLGDWEFTSINADGDINPAFTQVYREFWGIEPDYGVQGTPLALKDTMTLKAGAECRLGRWFAVRAGFARHESSAATTDITPLYPDLARNVYSVGGGYEGPLFSIYDSDEAIGQLSLDIALRYSPASPATSTLPGMELAYASRRWSVGIGVGFDF
jgi:long-chain fatty acid transport protein